MADIKLHECRIAKRGKGAKGTIVVTTFGVPVIPKDSKVVKTWDYSSFHGMAIEDAIEKAEELSGNVNLCEALFRGIDAIRKSAGLQSQSAIILLAQMILAEGLAIDIAEAKSVAIAWTDIRNKCKSFGLDIPEISFLKKKRELEVAKLKKDGLWKVKTSPKPNLVKKNVPEVEEETTEDSEVEDSDEEDSEEDSE